MFNLILLFQDDWLIQSQLFKVHTGFTAEQVSQALSSYEESICPPYRKKRTYVSGLLSRNEVNSNYRPNRKLFIRSEHGYYIVNPDIHIKTLQGWKPITSICNFKSAHLMDHFLLSSLTTRDEMLDLLKKRERWKTMFKVMQ